MFTTTKKKNKLGPLDALHDANLAICMAPQSWKIRHSTQWLHWMCHNTYWIASDFKRNKVWLSV